jgi:hypothetical protein
MYPEGDHDKIRFMDNFTAKRNAIESWIPGIESDDNPVHVSPNTAREVLSNAWIDDDRVINTSSKNVGIFVKSEESNSSTGKDTREFFDAFGVKIPRGQHLGMPVYSPFEACYYRDEESNYGYLSVNLPSHLAFNKIPGCMRGSKIRTLYYRNINRIENLDGMDNMEKFMTEKGGMTRIEGFDNPGNITELTISDTPMDKIQGLDEMKNLKELRLANNNIAKIEGLDRLRNLVTLTLDNNKIAKMEGLGHLRNLETLSLSHFNKTGGVEKIEGLGRLRNLRTLDLSDNNIKKIGNLGKNIDLEEIYLSGNSIKRIDGISGLRNLKELHLRNNKIKSIAGLEQRITLKKVDLSANDVRNFRDVKRPELLRDIDIDLRNNRHLSMPACRKFSNDNGLSIKCPEK